MPINQIPITPTLVAFDTGMIINFILSQNDLYYFGQIWSRYGHTFVLSSGAEGESIRKLVKSMGYEKNIAIQKVDSVISTLEIRRENTTDIDEDEGIELTRKYGKDEDGNDICHSPDNIIIAHYKRLRIGMVLTVDEDFAHICDCEGIGNFLFLPRH